MMTTQFLASLGDSHKNWAWLSVKGVNARSSGTGAVEQDGATKMVPPAGRLLGAGGPGWMPAPPVEAEDEQVNLILFKSPSFWMAPLHRALGRTSQSFTSCFSDCCHLMGLQLCSSVVFQSWVFWGLGSPGQVLKVEVLDVGSKPFTP